MSLVNKYLSSVFYKKYFKHMCDDGSKWKAVDYVYRNGNEV